MTILVVVIGIVIVITVVVVGVVGALATSRRREGLEAAAAARGWSYSPERDHEVALYFSFLDETREIGGHNPYALDVIRGQWNGWTVMAFSHHAETWDRDADGNRDIDHHWHAVVALQLPIPAPLPELTVAPWGLFGQVGAFLVDDNVEFPHAPEFAKVYRVRSASPRLAYDVCHPAMVHYLLANPRTTLELEGHWLATIERGHLQPNDLDRRLAQLGHLASLLPPQVIPR